MAQGNNVLLTPALLYHKVNIVLICDTHLSDFTIPKICVLYHVGPENSFIHWIPYLSLCVHIPWGSYQVCLFTRQLVYWIVLQQHCLRYGTSVVNRVTEFCPNATWSLWGKEAHWITIPYAHRSLPNSSRFCKEDHGAIAVWCIYRLSYRQLYKPWLQGRQCFHYLS